MEMYSKYEYIFQENIILTMERLKLETGRPRESILRDLKKIGYYSSYNARGKFYTLEKTPTFDGNGLWKFQNAYFSIRRTLLETAEYLINVSDAGYTHDELRGILGIEIHNALFQLTESGKLIRCRIGERYVYFSHKNIGGQEEKRKSMRIDISVKRPIKISKRIIVPEIEPMLVIEILVAVLRGNHAINEAYSYLQQAGSPVTAQQVEMVFKKYDISKKNS
jgi:hypothetical protein